MKFTLISDVHVDNNVWQWELLDSCNKDIPIVLAGDVANDVWFTSNFLKALRNRFSEVVFVAGNHDMYNVGFNQTRLKDDPDWPYPGNVAELYDHYATWCHHHDIHFLNRTSIVLDGVEFLGTTGWHDFRAGEPHVSVQDQIYAWKNYISDSGRINWDSADRQQAVMNQAIKDSDWLLHNSKQKSDIPKVMVTHHIPHRACTIFQPGDQIWNALNGSFCNTLMERINDPSVKAWCFGHTHYNWDKDINGIRYICNPRGYRGEKSHWEPVEVEV